jgi:hypothetical protein
VSASARHPGLSRFLLELEQAHIAVRVLGGREHITLLNMSLDAQGNREHRSRRAAVEGIV